MTRATIVERAATAHELMVRTVGLFGMAGLFLLISPDIRYSIAESAMRAEAYLTNYSPYSYAVLVVMGLITMYLLAKSAVGSR